MKQRIGTLTLVVVLSLAAHTTQSADKPASEPASGGNVSRTLSRLLGASDDAFKKLDADKNGGVSKDEFARFLLAASNGKITAEFSGKLFDRADANADGTLTLDELRGLMGSGESQTPSSPAEPKSDESKPAAETKPTTEAKPESSKPADSAGDKRGAGVARLLGPLEAAYKKMDSDSNGKVTVDEFCKYASDASRGRLQSKLGTTIFQKYDADMDGNLTIQELQKLYPSSSEPAVAISPATIPSEVKKSEKPPTTEVGLETRSWQSGAQASLPAPKLDQFLATALAAEGRDAAAPLDDEHFLRRVTLDLTGKPPAASDVEAFLRNTDPAKRAAAIDRLLASDDFARHWARFWRDVMQSKASSTQVIFDLHRGEALEQWLFERLKHNRSWAEVARDLITAVGALYVPTDAKDGNVAFLLCHTGNDAEVGRAVDTTRVFLGIQLECAQCHNHPTDIWKREQFHEFAAYFARVRDGKTMGAGRSRGLQLTSTSHGEYEMPDKYDTSKTTVTHPRFFLTGEALSQGMDDRTRRQALAEQVSASEWFAKAFVNRVWGHLMGRGFVEPVDNLGPSQKPIYPEVLDALAASFIASDFNIKELFSLIATSQAYQREIRIGESRHEHLHFAGAYPMRLRGEELWDSLVVTVGPFAERQPLPESLREVLGRIRDPDFFTVFNRIFDYDPTLGANEVEPSVAQALMLMNNKAINSMIRATGDTPLARILKQYPDNDEAIRQVYLQVLSRQPNPGEFESSRQCLKQVDNRTEALEDLMWVLVNSAEFRTKH